MKKIIDKIKKNPRFVCTSIIVALAIILASFSFTLWDRAENVCDESTFGIADGMSDNDEVEKKFQSILAQTIDDLNTDDFERFVRSLDQEQKNALGFVNVKRLLKRIVEGETKDFFTLFWDALGKDVGGYFVGFLPALLTVIVVCVLKNVLSGMTSGFLNNSTTEVVGIVCYMTVIVTLMVAVCGVIETAVQTISALVSFSAVVFPVLLTLLSALGTGSVATYQPMMAVLSGGVLSIIKNVIVPSFIACVVFSVVGNLSKNVRLNKFTKLFKSASTWLVGIAFGLFGVFLTAGGISGGVVDKMSFNVTKLALSSYVPILGGYLSDGFDLVVASLSLVKNAFGYVSVLVLVAVVVFPIVKILTFTLAMRLTSAIVEPIGDERVSGMLTALADNTSLIITALAGVAFMFFILIMLIMLSCNFG